MATVPFYIGIFCFCLSLIYLTDLVVGDRRHGAGVERREKAQHKDGDDNREPRKRVFDRRSSTGRYVLRPLI